MTAYTDNKSVVGPRTLQLKVLPRGLYVFTMVELLVVVAIIAIIAGMLMAALSKARESARLSFCANNVRQIGHASLLYENSWNSMPLDNLPESLRSFDGNRKLYNCPSDPDHEADSYTPFYVARATQDPGRYVVGCFRHVSGTRGPVLYGMSVTKTCAIQPVYRNGGHQVAFGEDLTGKTATFTDGSSAKVTGAGSMTVLMSFREPRGRTYSVVKVKWYHHCSVSATVNHGSAFEVVTPSSIASALGTQYKVTASETASDFIADLSVTAGTVEFASRAARAKGRKVKAGGNGHVGLAKGRCPK